MKIMAHGFQQAIVLFFCLLISFPLLTFATKDSTIPQTQSKEIKNQDIVPPNQSTVQQSKTAPTQAAVPPTTQEGQDKKNKKESDDKEKKDIPIREEKKVTRAPLEKDIFWHCDCEKAFTFENVHGYVQFATNMRYRGISYTNNRPFLSTLITYTHCSGGYIGFFSGNTQSEGTTIFIEPFVGVRKSCGCYFFDFLVGMFVFPKHRSPRELNFLNVDGAIGIKMKCLTSKFGLAWSPDFYLELGTQFYPYWNTILQLACRFSLIFEFGYQYLQHGRVVADFPSHFVFDIALQRDFKGFYSGFRFIATDQPSHDLLRPVFIWYIGRAF